MFGSLEKNVVWFDGKMNPCDTDYKSDLITGNVREVSLS